MTSFRFTILALSAAALSVSASAPAAADGGRSVKDHQSDRPFLWSGAYAGFHVGGRWGDYRVAGNGEAFDLNDREANKVFSLNPDNLIGGVQVGYGVQAGRFVLGVEADVSFGNARDEFFGTEFPDDQFARVRLGTQGALTARLGLPFGQVMPYIKGGLALTRISVSAGDVDDNKPVPESSTTESKTLTGWTIGGGLEYAVHGNWTARAEYLFTDYRSFTTTDARRGLYEHDLDTHSVRLGLNYRFGK